MDKYESEGEDEFDGDSGEEGQGFAIGTVVFPVDRAKDFVDMDAVLLNPTDTYIGKYLGEFLSERVIGSSSVDAGEEEEDEDEEDFDEEEQREPRRQRTWKVLGTIADRMSDIPNFLWAVMRTDDFDAYIKEVIKCSCVVYDITNDQSLERFAEIRAVVDALREKSNGFRARRVFILISSLHSWSHTNRTDDDMLTEENYRRRRTKPLYRELQLLERYVVASGKMTRGMLKAYVIGAGAVYGAEEFPLHQWFKGAWHNSKYLPIYGTGKNYMPTIYIKDLAAIVQNVMDSTPRKQRYIIAVDPVVLQQDQIVKAISDVLGTGRVKRVSEDEIYLNKELTTFQADQILLDLRIETAFCKDNFNIDWTAQGGFTSVIQKLASEYRKARNLTPLKVLIIGPPGIGKTTVARQVSDIYRLHHFTLKEMIETTRELLRDMAGEESEPDIIGMDVSAEQGAREVAKALLSEIDTAEVENEQLPDDIIVKIYRYRLLTNPSQNQGFILDGWPEKYEQAKALFKAGDDLGEQEEEEEGEDGLDRLDYRLMPDRVFIFEAPDEFLKERLGRVPLAQLDDRHQEQVYEKSLAAYREANVEYDTSLLAYLDEQEIIYFPVDIVPDTSPSMQGTVTHICGMLGKPRNYGITREEEEALRNAQLYEQAEFDQKEKEELALLETRELEERRKNIQEWMEKLAKVKKEEFQREESALVPLRMYLMAHIVPTLTKGLIDVTRARPDDPIDFLAEFLFQNNPGGINPSADTYLK